MKKFRIIALALAMLILCVAAANAITIGSVSYKDGKVVWSASDYTMYDVYVDGSWKVNVAKDNASYKIKLADGWHTLRVLDLNGDDDVEEFYVGATATPTPKPTATPTPKPTATPTPKPTEVPTPVPTEVPTPVPTEVPTPVPTEVPTPVPTAEPTAVPTAEPTAVPTAEPTAVPTAEPTAVPTAEPTAVPTAEPTAVPTAAPTADSGNADEDVPKTGDSMTVSFVMVGMMVLAGAWLVLSRALRRN